jgi:hypothetical protein
MEKSLKYILIFVFLSLYIPVLSQEVNNNNVPDPYKRTAQTDSFNIQPVDNTAQQSAYSKYHKHHHGHHRVISNNYSKGNGVYGLPVASWQIPF